MKIKILYFLSILIFSLYCGDIEDAKNLTGQKSLSQNLLEQNKLSLSGTWESEDGKKGHTFTQYHWDLSLPELETDWPTLKHIPDVKNERHAYVIEINHDKKEFLGIFTRRMNGYTLPSGYQILGGRYFKFFWIEDKDEDSIYYCNPIGENKNQLSDEERRLSTQFGTSTEGGREFLTDSIEEIKNITLPSSAREDMEQGCVGHPWIKIVKKESFEYSLQQESVKKDLELAGDWDQGKNRLCTSDLCGGKYSISNEDWNFRGTQGERWKYHIVSYNNDENELIGIHIYSRLIRYSGSFFKIYWQRNKENTLAYTCMIPKAQRAKSIITDFDEVKKIKQEDYDINRKDFWAGCEGYRWGKLVR